MFLTIIGPRSGPTKMVGFASATAASAAACSPMTIAKLPGLIVLLS
jgi:hypothetical protein